MRALLQTISWPEWRMHRARHAMVLLAVALGVALAFSVHLINASALAEFGAAVRAVNGDADFELRGAYRGAVGGFDERLYERVAAHPQVAIASPVVEIDTVAFGTGGKRVPLRVLGVDSLVAPQLSPALLPRPADPARRFAPLDPDALFLNPAAQRELGVVAGLDPDQLVLAVQRDHLQLLLDEAHRRRQRHRHHVRAGTQLHVDRPAVGGCIDRGLVQVPLRVGDIGARRIGVGLGRRQLRLGGSDARQLAIHPSGELARDLRLAGGGGGELRLEVGNVGLGLLQREAVAGAGGDRGDQCEKDC